MRALSDRGQNENDPWTQAWALFICREKGVTAFIKLCDGACVNEGFGSHTNDHC
jgi:hypothetical protein